MQSNVVENVVGTKSLNKGDLEPIQEFQNVLDYILKISYNVNIYTKCEKLT